MKNEVSNFSNKGIELIKQEKYGEALQWYVFAI